MTSETATTPAAGDALRVIPAEVAGATRAMFLSTTSAFPMLRGPMVAYAPEDDGAGGGAAPGGEADQDDDNDQDDEDSDADRDDDDGDDDDQDDEDNEDEEDLEDVEFEGKNYKLPKEVKRGLLREADYTQKTQALSAAAKALDAERVQHAEMTQALRADLGKVHSLEDRVEKFKALPWEQLRASNPDEYRELRDEYQIARDDLLEAQGSLKQKEDDFREKERQSDATRLSETEAALRNPETGIKGWGPQLFQELVGFAGTHGLSPSDLRQASVGEWKLLHLAKLGAQAQQQQQKVQRHKTTQKTRPAAEVKGNAPSQGLNSVKSTDEWMRRRSAQAAKRSRS